MAKPLYYYDETWMENFWFFIGWSPTATADYLGDHWDCTGLRFDGTGKAVEFTGPKSCIAIWTKSKIKKPEDYAVLAHECVHAAHMILHKRGVKSDFENDEVEAYLVGQLMRRALGYRVR